MSTTTIEWATDSLNPGVYGCGLESPACTNCYAMTMAARLERMGRAEYAGLTRDGRWTGEVRVAPVAEAVERIRRYPRSRSFRRRIFVTSMADLLHADVPLAWIVEVIVAMAARPDADWLVLTKRAARWPEVAAAVIWRLGSWPRNVWPGVTVEDQKRADERIPYLLEVQGAVHWLSMEPLLGTVDLTHIRREVHDFGRDDTCLINALTGAFQWGNDGDESGVGPALAWVIAGGESGPKARPSHPDWFRSLRDQCVAAGVAFHFKQWGEWGAVEAPPDGDPRHWTWADGSGRAAVDAGVRGPEVYRWRDGKGSHVRLGKREAGRLLDGRTWDEVPG